MTEYTPEQIAQASFKYFFVKVYGFKWAPHFDEWQWLIENCPRFLLMCSRGHGKTIFIIGYCLWLIYRGYPVDILLLSFSEEQVKLNIMNKIEETIMTNEYLARLRPNSKQLWGAQIKTFPNGSIIRGESFGSSIRGAHPDYIFPDDPLKDRGGMTPEEQYNYAMTVIAGMAKRNTVIGYIGTPLDNGDLLDQLEQNPAYVTRKYPALNEQGEPLFPTLYTKEELLQKEKEVGSFAFSREFMLQRIDTKNQMFKDQYRNINDKREFPEFQCVRTIIDPAASETTSACDSAIVTVGVDFPNHKWELDTRLLHADDPAALLNEVLKVAMIYSRKYSDYAIVCEAEVFQKWVANDLRNHMLKHNLDVRVIEVTHQGTLGKNQRIEGLQPAWEARAIHLLPESPLISQFRFFRPNIRGFKIDGIDAFSWIRDERVSVPTSNVTIIDEGVPPDAWL